MQCRLVADVGGTNSRLAFSQGGKVLPQTPRSYTNADWGSLYEVIDDYLTSIKTDGLDEMVIAVAGPVQKDRALLTNRDWTIENDILKHRFACHQTYILNDLTALGYSVPVLQKKHLTQLNLNTTNQTGITQSLVVGIGTGFNVSPVVDKAGIVVCPAAEAGHMSMPVELTEELAKIGIARDQFPTVETLFSGRGFTIFCQKLVGHTQLDGRVAIDCYGNVDADKITYAIDQYSSLLGHLLRELSLIYMPSSGIYLAGSVARAVLNKAQEPCLNVFLRPCIFHENTQIPVWIIKDDSAALLGCAGYSNF